MTLSLLRMPMFGFFGLGFLFFCTIVAVAVWLAVKSGEHGSTKLGGFAGCAVAFALLVIAGLGALGCTAIALLNTPAEWARRGPVRRLEAHWNDHDAESADKDTKEPAAERPEPDRHALWIRVEVPGGDPAVISRWFHDNTDGDFTVSITSEDGPDGRISHVEIGLPMSPREIRRIRRDLEKAIPSLDLPDGVTVELKDEDE